MLEKITFFLNPDDRDKALNKAATENEIRSVENHIGVKFPEQLKKLYTEANGESGSLLSSPNGINQLFYSFDFLNLTNVVDTHKLHSEAYPDYFGELICYPEDFIKSNFFNTKWIPFAFAGDATYLAVDLDPEKKGTIGQIIVYGADSLPNYFVLSPDLNSFIQSLSMYLSQKDYRKKSIFKRKDQPNTFLNNAYDFYESEQWRNYSEDEFRDLLNHGRLPFWSS